MTTLDLSRNRFADKSGIVIGKWIGNLFSILLVLQKKTDGLLLYS